MKQCGSNAQGLAETNQLKGVEQSNSRNSRKGYRLSRDESRFCNNVEDKNYRHGTLVRGRNDGEKTHQQPQESNNCWDQILPLKSIKILLVENDESTRHIVSALLRKCRYEVAAVVNGLQAWEMLENTSFQVDIVLTELAMPGLSGIDLLNKIMHHETHNNIPVIVMSSDGSLDIVFNCLSKGAIDFLVKPIRKNELKNLWQHVWRKSYQSSGSGSVRQILKPGASTGVKEYDKKTTRDVGGDDNGSMDLNNRDGSDHGSGTESYWNQKPLEFYRAPSLDFHVDDICPQATRSMTEALRCIWKPAIATKELKESDGDDAVIGKDLEIGCRSIAALPHEDPCGKVLDNTSCDGEKYNRRTEKLDVYCDVEKDEPSAHAADLMSTMAVSDTKAALSQSLNYMPMVSETNGNPVARKELLSLELSLKQVGDCRNVGTCNPNAVRRSGFSAFIRHYPSATGNQPLSGNVGSSSVAGNSSVAASGESAPKFQSKFSVSLLKQTSNGSSENNDKGSTTCMSLKNSLEVANDQAAVRTINSQSSCSAFKRVKHHHLHYLQCTAPGKDDDVVPIDTVMVQAGEINQHIQVHHHHYYADYMTPQKKLKIQDEYSTEVSALAPEFQPSCYFSITGASTLHGNNRSDAPGCDDASFGQTENDMSIYASDVLMDSDLRMTFMAGDGGRSAQGEIFCTSRLEAHKKYRQKKKDRCFGTKVRYESRRQLAAQRQRVKGQFVRHTVYENYVKNPISVPELSCDEQ